MVGSSCSYISKYSLRVVDANQTIENKNGKMNIQNIKLIATDNQSSSYSDIAGIFHKILSPIIEFKKTS